MTGLDSRFRANDGGNDDSGNQTIAITKAPLFQIPCAAVAGIRFP